MKEPQIHSHITDVLPENHPLAERDIICDHCEEHLHASNNECTQTWVETGRGSFCLGCFISELKARAHLRRNDKYALSVLESEWGL